MICNVRPRLSILFPEIPGINLGDMKRDGSETGNDRHGTCCAGIAATHISNLDPSSTGIAGMAGKCQILPVALENATNAEVAAGIRYAADNGARIISMSFVFYKRDEGLVDPAISYAVDTKGCILCAAAGNNDDAHLLYPACNPKVIACGASDQLDNRKSPNSPDGKDWGKQIFTFINPIIMPGN